MSFIGSHRASNKEFQRIEVKNQNPDEREGEDYGCWNSEVLGVE